MSVLASLLVRDQLIPVDRVQQAIQEQVIRGGNLDTVLLELGYVAENTMNAYSAAVFGLLPGTRDEVMRAPIGTIRSLPREFAVRHRLIPVARTEDAVVLAVDRPLPEATLREISFELGIDPVQRIVCSVRVEAGLAQHYDIEMTTRMRYLNEMLMASDPGPIPYVAPFEGVGKRSSLPPKKEVSGSFPRVESSVPAPVGTGRAPETIRSGWRIRRCHPIQFAATATRGAWSTLRTPSLFERTGSTRSKSFDSFAGLALGGAVEGRAGSEEVASLLTSGPEA